MKQLLFIITILIAASFSGKLYAQDTVKQNNMPTQLSIGTNGVKLTKDKKWNHVKTPWAAADQHYAMTRIDSNDYAYTINNIREFYGVGKDTAIEKIAVIFKDSAGKKQTTNLYITVMKKAFHSKPPHNPVVTTVPEQVLDSTQTVTIHFHPYGTWSGAAALRGYNGTIYIYTGLLTNPPYDNVRDDDGGQEGSFSSHWGMLDLGFNTIIDNTNYNSPAVKSFLSNVPANRQNSSLFDLRNAKSINVNIYPFMETFNALKRKNQKINISAGIGLQLYNFRYQEPVVYTHSPNSVVLSSTTFGKNKLAFDYLNIPLMLTFKTRLSKDRWLVYGAGITGGYSISTWLKQKSGENGKQKFHDDFGFDNFNSCLTAEIGITGIRLYATYQLTNMFDASTGMVQHPISFGFRFFAL